MTKTNGTKKQGPGERSAYAAPKAKALFALGETYLSRGVSESVPILDVIQGILRHAHGDWGNLDPIDWAQNELALQDGARLLSAYRADNGVKFWIITEWDRSVTTVLLPAEY